MSIDGNHNIRSVIDRQIDEIEKLWPSYLTSQLYLGSEVMYTKEYVMDGIDRDEEYDIVVTVKVRRRD